MLKIRLTWLSVALFLCSGCSAARSAPVSGAVKGGQKSVVSPPLKSQVVQKGHTVFLDPGHGGRDGGGPFKIGKFRHEKTLTLDVARRVERLLVTRGYKVVMSREQDTAISLAKRVEMANQERADIVVSIHFNAASSPASRGAEILFWKNSATPVRSRESKRLGMCILQQLQNKLSIKARGVKSANLYVVRETKVPSVIVESAFMTNPKEAKLLATPVYRQQIASAISQGIDEYFCGKSV